jgi:SAM-dependent methyltransferase
MTNGSPCSLGDEALAQRVRAWEALRAAQIRSERTTDGAVVQYRLDTAVARTLVELIEAERRCCPSVSFEATVTLRIQAPETMRSWVASTFADREEDRPTTDGSEPGSIDRGAIEEAVRSHYAAAARRAAPPDAGPRRHAHVAGIGAGAYPPGELAALPDDILRSSIGCANPVVVADLRPGDVVLDLGSGGGLDVLLSARRVGPTGKAYGLDMTDEMLRLARRNQVEAGIDNAQFLRGRIEAIPLPDESVDVVLSNCVIGLSTDKEAVFAESYRVLRPGGCLAIADVVAEAEASAEQRAAVDNWISCLAGSLTRPQYRAVLEGAGFVAVSLDERHPVTDGFDSVIVRATKPADGG